MSDTRPIFCDEFEVEGGCVRLTVMPEGEVVLAVERNGEPLHLVAAWSDADLLAWLRACAEAALAAAQVNRPRRVA